MAGLVDLLQSLCGGQQPNRIAVTRPGLVEAVPDLRLSLLAPQAQVLSAATGPDGGAAALKRKLAELDVPWQQQEHQQQQQRQQDLQQQQACGSAISLYDRDAATGRRNGEPIADCYGILSYRGAAIMALADGVNWGERPRAAARGAVHGFLAHVHQELAVKQGGKAISSDAAFAILQGAVQAAQAQVLAADGTLTTLVGAVVLQQRMRSGKHCCLSVVIGDSPSYVWRAAAREVEELNYQPPLHGFHRDPRICPGCLGYALGDAPDLSNISYSVTSLDKGDVVFLASDGIADNFDPVGAVHALLSFVERGTAAQRQVLEQASADGGKGPEELGDLIANLPGKMDHASVVAYKVG
ncbi:hypothetical protein OEZ85_004028 [Tetradesmus obliquus]|uniref:PPM-type phosphatase domain-containing protein n=1 Tax=Tetradesmus obliquus TaxID=3088 RepID=A0ABY8UD64_TETOB|nr:hypothetical protein OEZ85_004028 [Tetradesmus obliquus]